MYSYFFYLILWAICFIMVLPVLIVGVLYIFMSNKPVKKEEFTIEIMLSIIKGAKTKQAFEAALTQFKSKYKVFDDDKHFDTWINCIKELAHSTNWDTDAVAKFGQELEDANTAHAKKISIAIATVLKTKDQKK
ncbi:hypothetical protein CQA53_07855 [Helicobacter didelphidarum]|uniref:Uncharacterized protein n=1 Tax=Helicobacter didelphidarum TaxID=2040648 RepID=A0A3D8II46_9HELI|nr:hypothetical protein [Helicobacter didelphidarum]RDU64231.1 hypothetical protein CQA53_07855 [Helicobacter didelphidarum]